ncbi:7TM-DISM domain-containing protein [Marinoscillum luteum]|uniref:7TM-DISM domain-containing protein n=1 Tax=Marinoscillum luteum TaxID=861051 RepID=A0ABW7NGV7_9BACT
MRSTFYLVMVFVLGSLHAQTLVYLTDEQEHYVVQEHMDYLIDSTQHFSVTDLSTRPEIFQPILRADVVPDHLDDYLWLRLTVKNERSDLNESWYFESWGFDIDEISFFIPTDSGNFQVREMGYDLPFNTRPIFHKNFTFLLDVHPGETKTYFIKIKRSYPLQFSFHIRTNEAFIFHALNEYLFLGLYYGFLFIIMFFSLYLTVKLRDKLYVYFSLLIAATIWYSFSRDGLGFQFLWPTFPALNYFAKQRIAELLLIISTLAFSSKFLNNTGDYHRIRLLTWTAIGLKFCISFYEEIVTPISSDLGFILSLGILGVPFVAGLIAQIRRNQFLWLSNIAFLCLFLSFVQVYASDITIISNLVINWYLFNAGIFLEVSFFSLSIISQIVSLRRQNERANKERILILQEHNRVKDELNTRLEAKVAERTRKIEDLLEDLAEKNELLEANNIRLEDLNAQVSEMNQLLSRDNKKLKTDIDEVSRARVLMKGVDFEEFKKIFSDKIECFKFLSEIKWKDGFKCKKCGYNKHGEGRIPFGRRCKNCNYDESPTTFTLFHKLKFPIEKAFYMVYLINRKDADYTLNELSELLELRRETCWAFKQKILTAIEKSDHHKDLSGWDTLTLISLE